METRQKDLYIEALSKTGLPAKARTFAGVSRHVLNKALEQDPDFEEQVEEAMEQAYDALEEEARRRAVEGVQKGVYYKGELMDYQTEYSDSLLMFLLKGRRREVFGDKTTIAGSKAEPLTINVVDVLGEGHSETVDPTTVREAVKAVVADSALIPSKSDPLLGEEDILDKDAQDLL